MSTPTCIGPECDRPVSNTKHGVCKSHATQLQRRRPLAPLRERDATRERTCSIDGCDAPHEAKGMCNRHYRAARRPAPEPKPTTCIGPECTRPVQVVKRSMCKPHSKQLLRRGSIDKLTPLEAPRGSHATPRTVCAEHPDRPSYARSMCRSCYLAARRGPRAERAARMCNFHGCDRAHHANGWCSAHNNQVQRGRTPFALGSRGRGPVKGTASPKRGKSRTDSGLPAGWFRKTKPVKTKPARHELDAGAIVVDFNIPTLPDELTRRARQRLIAMGADDLLDMLGLEAS